MNKQNFPFHYMDGTLVCEGDIVLGDLGRSTVQMILTPGTDGARDFNCFDTGGLLLKSEKMGFVVCLPEDERLELFKRGKNYELIQGLRSLAEELKPFTQEIKAGSRVWDGTVYEEAAPRQADPYALMWWGVLTTIAEFLETHESQSREKNLLLYKLFKGKDSFNDYSIDVNHFGDAAKAANQRIREKQSLLFEIFVNWIRNLPRDTNQGGGPL